MKKPTSPARPASQDTDPLVDAAEVGEQEARDLFREVSLLVGYADYATVSFERFRAAKRLAMLDLWSDAPDAEKAPKAGTPLDVLEELRASETYERLRVALAGAFVAVSRPKKPAEWIEAMEDLAFRRLARIARHAIDPKVAAAAARDFADRALPKVSRNREGEGGAPVLMITEDGARLLMAALETVQRKTTSPPTPLQARPTSLPGEGRLRPSPQVEATARDLPLSCEGGGRVGEGDRGGEAGEACPP